jgi:lysyl-tRNA synthetase class 2
MLWEDYFFLLFLNKIENDFHRRNFLMLYEFPRDLSALSTLKESDPRVCERFEIYIKGVELCNCFNELRDLEVQKKRFEEQRSIKQQFYGYQLPEPQVLFKSLEKGFPPSAGNALGVERLLLSLLEIQNPFFD